jgi:hypothetical protein
MSSSINLQIIIPHLHPLYFYRHIPYYPAIPPHPESSGCSATEENEDGSLRFCSIYSSLQESRQLCQAVYAALLTDGRQLLCFLIYFDVI